MELEHTNPNGEIVLAKKLNHMEFFFWKIVKIAFRNESYKLFLSRRCFKCLKNKIVHNFFKTNPNGTKQSFPDRQKYNLWTEKIQKKNTSFCKKNCCPVSPVLNLFGHNFFSWAPIEKKLYSHEAYQFIYFQKKFQEIWTKIQLVGTCPKSHLSPKETMVL